MNLLCIRCRATKDSSEFSKCTARSTGHSVWCKACYKEYVKANQERLKENGVRYREKNRETRNSKCSQYYYTNRDEINKKRRIKNKDCKEEKSAQDREYYRHNSEKVRAKAKEYRDTHKAERRMRWKQDAAYRASALLRCRIRSILGENKIESSVELLRGTIDEVLDHMGPMPSADCHIDHKCPFAQAKNEEEKIKLCNYINLQWLPASENLQKSSKRTPDGEELCRVLLGREWED